MQIMSCDDLMSRASLAPQYPMVLHGLKAGHIGMLIAAPGIGKSRLALSIAMEVAGNMELIGLRAQQRPLKTLMISCEDVADILVERVNYNLNQCQQVEVSTLHNYLDFCCDIAPIVIPPEASRERALVHLQHIEELAKLFSKYELVIIDTVSEIIGDCDEVKHDRQIKNTLNHLAKKSKAALLLVHHVTKDDIRGKNKLTMASGSGLSTLIRLSKFQIGLINNNGLELVFLKHNYLRTDQACPIRLHSDEGGMITAMKIESKTDLIAEASAQHEVIEQATLSDAKAAQPRSHYKAKSSRKNIYTEPDSIEISASKQKKDDPIGDVRNVI